MHSICHSIVGLIRFGNSHYRLWDVAKYAILTQQNCEYAVIQVYCIQ